MSTISLIVPLVVLVMLIVFSGLVSASEIAFFSLNTAQINNLQGRKTEEVKWLWNRPEKLLATILIYNNLINVSFILLATWTIGKTFYITNPIVEFIVDVVIITSVILAFGELYPKIFANVRALYIARLMATPLRIAMIVLYPLVIVLVKSTLLIDKRIKKKNYDVSREDLNEAINYSTKFVEADQEETKLLKGIVSFGDKEVTEIMTSRIDAVTLSAEFDFEEVKEVIKETGYSRYPVYGDTIDDIIGILHIKDVLPLINEGENQGKWQDNLRPIYAIPESKNIKDLLKDFQNKKMHMAVVVDEYGGFSGLITLEDVIEEIVGEISDEFDEEEDLVPYRKIRDNCYEVEGKVLINDFLRIADLPDEYATMAKGEVDTLAGFLLEIKGEFPVKGEIIMFKNLKFTIKETDTRRIILINIEVLNNNESEEN